MNLDGGVLPATLSDVMAHFTLNYQDTGVLGMLVRMTARPSLSHEHKALAQAGPRDMHRVTAVQNTISPAVLQFGEVEPFAPARYSNAETCSGQ